ncbi:Paxillin [Trametes pubescens]|uniref:Paxillin n=1 Tax=Trametes pubescens TaxID=154538 RepID=A0A1M2VIT1_TRAPU|nr:Paxillin [Trametes pubescens]
MNSSPLPPSPVGPPSHQFGQQYRPVGPPSNQFSQQYKPPPSPQPHPARTPSNPYPSPVSPQSSQMGAPQSARRPLPDPRGLPPAPQSAGLVAVPPRPPTSPQPAYATHRPTQSVPSVFPSHPQPNASSNAHANIPQGQDPSPTSSAFSTTSTSPPRPLPLPRSTGNFDLSSVQQTQALPQSPPKRALPAPLPAPTRETNIRSPEPILASPGQKFVPLWKRTLPQPGASQSRALPATSATENRQQGTVERRSTVSTSRPLPSPSTNNTTTVGLPRDSYARVGTLPPHLQLPNLPPTPQAPAEQPSNPVPAPTQRQPAVLPNTSSSPPSSRFALRERSRTLPLAAAAPNYPLPPKPSQPPPPPSPRNVTDRPLSQSPPSSDDEELTNALLERHPRSPSPQFGIRDLPRNSQPHQTAAVRPSNTNGEGSTRIRRELPSPVPAPQNQVPSPPQSGNAETSLAFRMASVSLESTPSTPSFRPGHSHSNSLSNTNSTRPMPQPPANAPSGRDQQLQQQQQQQSQPQPLRNVWPPALPPLPRAPASPQPVTPSGFAQTQPRSRPLPSRSNTATGNLPPFAQPRSPRKADLDLSLDDAPPPSLRRSPALPSSRPPSGFGSSQPQQMSGRAGTAPAGAPLRREPSQAASVFSLSSFPQPPTHVEVKPQSPTKHGFRPPSPAKSSFGSASPTKSGFGASSSTPSGFGAASSNFGQGPPTPSKSSFAPQSPQKSSFGPPPPTKQDTRTSSPTKPQFNVRAPSPTKYNPPTFTSPERSQPSPRIPKISFPANPDGDSDEDDAHGGPVINVSGPGESRSGGAPSLPRISFGDDDDDNGIPSINIGGVDDGPSIPQISLPGEPSSSNRDRRDRPQTRKVQETISNPRLEAAKRNGLVCGGCGGAIIGRIVSAMDMRWHPGCFRCCVCDELLENLSSFAHDGRPYCHLDYHEQFAPRCYHCQTAIVDERFITLDDPELGKRTYHEQHFFCAECGDPFLPPADPGAPSRTFAGDGEFAADDDVGFTVYRGHPYCETCHVRLRMPKCKKCKKSIRDGMQAVEALGGKWCWECFTCASCNKPFEDPAFFQRDGNPFCERCFSIMIRNEI